MVCLLAGFILTARAFLNQQVGAAVDWAVALVNRYNSKMFRYKSTL
jgi:hypothetical protein